jgi:hypothetical protein
LHSGLFNASHSFPGSWTARQAAPLQHHVFTQSDADIFYLWVQCVQRCCEKFMKHSARVGMRFAELSSQAEQQMQQLLQQQSGK